MSAPTDARFAEVFAAASALRGKIEELFEACDEARIHDACRQLNEAYDLAGGILECVDAAREYAKPDEG